MKTPKSIRRFVEIFSTLPGIGPRQAIRLAFHFIRQGKAFQDEIAKVIADFKDIGICKQCFYIHENKSGLCDFCEDDKREGGVIAVVEKETDVMSLENTGKYRGRYFVLGDVRKSGVLETDQKLRVKALEGWIKKDLGGTADEIVVAINPTVEGDVIAGLIAEQLKPFAKKISRLGRGIPTGGEIEFADEDTLGSAIEGRA